MLVETFEVPEVDGETGDVECDAEAIALIDALGLDGQKRFVTPGGVGERCPYRKATKDEMFVVTSFCPQITELAKYSDGPIPVRVLQVAAHAKDMFHKLCVYYPENGDVQLDPFLVGINVLGGGYTEEFFLLARWGQELVAWSEMRSAALKRRREMFVAKCREIAKLATVRAEIFGAMPDSALLVAQEPAAYHI